LTIRNNSGDAIDAASAGGGYAVYATATAGGVGVYGYQGGVGYAGYFYLNSPNTTNAQAALYAVNTGGGNTSGTYGQAAHFEITNPYNQDDALYATTSSAGNAIHGVSSTSKYTSAIFGESTAGYGVSGYSVTGTGVYGTTATGDSAYFVGGSGGGGYCKFNGGSNWNCTSDRNLKDHLMAADPKRVLQQVTDLPEWYYQMKKGNPKVRFLGPTAQDFKAAFALGEGDTTINIGNAQGVALTAIKGLNQKLDEALKAKNAEIADLKLEIAGAKSSREVEFAELKASLVALQDRLDAAAPVIKSVSLVSPPQ
jgi:hypothetical protein